MAIGGPGGVRMAEGLRLRATVNVTVSTTWR